MSNSDIRQWPTEHWQVAKVFMAGGQDRASVKATDIDASGVIQLINNCKQFVGIVNMTLVNAVSMRLYNTLCMYIIALCRDPTTHHLDG